MILCIENVIGGASSVTDVEQIEHVDKQLLRCVASLSVSTSDPLPGLSVRTYLCLDT